MISSSLVHSTPPTKPATSAHSSPSARPWAFPWQITNWRDPPPNSNILVFSSTPHLLKDIKKLENIQKFGLRMCSKQWNADYTDLLLEHNTAMLADRRRYLSLCTMYKVTNNLVDSPPDMFTLHRANNLRATPQFIQPFARTNALKFSFVPFCCSLWNTLPPYITHSQSLSCFKKELANHLLL